MALIFDWPVIEQLEQ